MDLAASIQVWIGLFFLISCMYHDRDVAVLIYHLRVHMDAQVFMILHANCIHGSKQTPFMVWLQPKITYESCVCVDSPWSLECSK